MVQKISETIKLTSNTFNYEQEFQAHQIALSKTK